MSLEKATGLVQRFRSPRRVLLQLTLFVSLSLFLLFVTCRGWPSEWMRVDWSQLSQAELDNITATAREFADHEIQAPYKDQFWEVGQRSRQLSQWISQSDKLNPNSWVGKELLATTETTAQNLFPFLQRPARNPESRTPLSDLRKSFVRGSRGIVIPVGGGEQSIRFAGHLIVSLRKVLGCTLPIQIAFAGDEDLSREERDKLAQLEGYMDIEFLNVFDVFDDSTMKLKDGGWAIKAFAVLASRFEQVILMDADAVFLQKPETLFFQRRYIEKGAYLFHDRLLWQHAFRSRHDWWKDQIKVPSPEMYNSLVWTEDYAEECDSGVVVVNKGRVDVLVGMLHVAWQNTYDVREEVTYKLTHGDKESWWLGLELGGSTYEFEKHYGSMIGWADDANAQNVTKVCSFVIAHTDDKDKLIWYNGSLLKNKKVDPKGYEVPEYWMVDGKWHKGATKADMSCMDGSEAIELTDEEKRVLKESIGAAKKVDEALKLKLD
ncbi:hypothetical protein MRS44_004144 [Fusarium solani]|uniref:uncharacterized protein n=1 Tax=Fusarium solani TaxID=169388 RepID=UPI0032C4A3F3|nr:hypothetical protein MRS44_004144 [Fusarium solani]